MLLAAGSVADGADSLLPREDIAIVGMACVFPGAPNLQAYWKNIVGKVDAITDPPDGWGPDSLYDPASNENDRIPCKRGGFLGDLARFDPMEFGVMPRSVDGAEPDHFLALQLARDALHDAGYGDPEKRPPGERIEIILGRGTYINHGWTTLAQHGLVVDQTLKILKQLHPEHSADELQAIRLELKANLPPFNAETAPGLVPNIITGRIANRLGFMGPNFIVDAACASSLIAVELGVRDLLIRTCDMVLVGGIQASTPPPLFMIFTQLGALSRRGQVRVFDKDADGTLLGEGGGIIVMKRLADAEREGDRIYAVVKGVGTSSDGRGLSVLTPRQEGQVLALQRAYEASHISPSTIELIEAHGTGTVVGDTTEIKTLRQVFGSRKEPYPSVAVGSVKSMISHLIPAAGIAGLIKTTLALYHGVLPPTLHCDEPKSEFELEKTPFYVISETRPWIHGVSDYPRRAGVNAFGFGGINAHVILEEHTAVDAEPHASFMDQWDSEVLIFEGDSRASLIEQGHRLHQYLSDAPPITLKDMAYTLNTELGEKPYRLALVASSLEDVSAKLKLALERLADPQRRQIKDRSGIYFSAEPLAKEGKLAFLFPGEGSQYVNMLHDLCLHFPEVREWFDRIDRALINRGMWDYRPSQLIFPPLTEQAKSDRESGDKGLWQMDSAVAAVTTANHALLTLLGRLGIRPQAVLGHSTGEYTALQASGVMGPVDEAAFERFVADLDAIHQHAATEDGIPRAALVAVGADSATVSEILDQTGDELHIAMDNCPQQTVIVGQEGDLERFIEQARQRGLIYEVLPFDRPYHTPLFATYAEHLRPFCARWLTRPPNIQLYSCTTMSPFPTDLAGIQELAIQHWMRPVEFNKTVEAMYANGVRIFVEVGPRGNLTAFVDAILRTRPHLAVASNVPSRSGITQLNHAVGLLAANGVPMRLDYLYARRTPQRLSLDASRDRAEIEDGTGKAMRLTMELPVLTLRQRSLAKAPDARETGLEPPRPVDRPTSLPVSTPTVQVGDREVGTQGPARLAASPAAATPPGEGQVADPVLPAAAGVLDSLPQQDGSGTAQVAHGSVPGLHDSRSLVLNEHFRTMERFLEVQQEVMQAYLAGDKTSGATARPVLTSETKLVPETPAIPAEPSTLGTARIAEAEMSAVAEVDQPSAAPSVPRPTSQEAVAVLDAEEIGQILLRLVSDKTGYPAEMLDLSLDLEADLGIDSIKRVEILGAFQRETGIILAEEMEQLAARKTLQSTIELLAGSGRGRATENERVGAREEVVTTSDDEGTAASRAMGQGSYEPEFPFVQKVVSLTPGEALVARCEIDLNTYPFLRDHTLGRDISTTDPGLTALAIMPLTMSMEMMAEAAAVLMPGYRLVGMKEVRAYRWIALDEERFTVQLSAHRLPSEAEVHVQIREAEGAEQPSSTPVPPLIEAIMVFAEAYPEPPRVDVSSLRQGEASKWPSDRLYKEAMFHGPAFRGVRTMESVGPDRAEATLEVLPLERLCESDASQSLLTDPILLDQPGQVVGFWAAQLLEEKHMIFPYRLEALRLFGPPLPTHEQVQCQAQIALVGDQQVRSDLEIVRADGRVWARFVGWEDRRFDLSWEFFRFMLSPREVVISRPWPTPVALLSGSGRGQVCQLSLETFPKGFFSAQGGIWRRTLTQLVLGRRERELWRSLRTPEPRRLEWLLGRVVAKDAVRQYLKTHYDLILCPADVEILPDADGRPVVGGKWTSQIPGVPILSLSHSAGMAVAAVEDCGAGTGIGVDIEQVGCMNQDMEDLAFVSEERELLASLREADRDEWSVRFWCAKEAVAKALGKGMIGGPQALVVQALDTQTGVVQIGLRGELARQVRDVDGSTLTGFTAREGDLVMATSLFNSNERAEEHEI